MLTFEFRFALQLLLTKSLLQNHFLKSSKSFDMNVRYFHFVEWLNSLCLGITMPSQNTIISLPFPELLAL